MSNNSNGAHWYSVDLEGDTITIETGKFAGQANGAVTISSWGHTCPRHRDDGPRASVRGWTFSR